jgi:hypothetical protein
MRGILRGMRVAGDVGDRCQWVADNGDRHVGDRTGANWRTIIQTDNPPEPRFCSVPRHPSSI